MSGKNTPLKIFFKILRYHICYFKKLLAVVNLLVVMYLTQKAPLIVWPSGIGLAE